MTTQVRIDEAATVSVRRMARKQITKALKTLGGAKQLLEDEDVHDARKRLKKARALLRLLRPALGAPVYRRENGSIRDAARPLTDMRDAKILVETLDKLAEHARGDLNSA